MTLTFVEYRNSKAFQDSFIDLNKNLMRGYNAGFFSGTSNVVTGDGPCSPEEAIDKIAKYSHSQTPHQRPTPG